MNREQLLLIERNKTHYAIHTDVDGNVIPTVLVTFQFSRQWKGWFCATQDQKHHGNGTTKQEAIDDLKRRFL